MWQHSSVGSLPCGLVALTTPDDDVRPIFYQWPSSNSKQMLTQQSNVVWAARQLLLILLLLLLSEEHCMGLDLNRVVSSCVPPPVRFVRFYLQSWKRPGPPINCCSWVCRVRSGMSLHSWTRSILQALGLTSDRATIWRLSINVGGLHVCEPEGSVIFLPL